MDDSMTIQFSVSLNHLVRPVEHRLRNRQAYLFSRLQIDHQLKFHRLLDGQISRLSSFQKFVDEDSGTAVQVNQVRSVARNATVLCPFGLFAHRWQPVLKRKLRKLSPVILGESTLNNYDRIGSLLGYRIIGLLKIVRIFYLQGWTFMPN
jgi:hypothetical protein